MAGEHFGFYGFDILLDDTGRPWLLEINNSPDMKVTNAVHARVKSAVLYDAIRLTMPSLVEDYEWPLRVLHNYRRAYHSPVQNVEGEFIGGHRDNEALDRQIEAAAGSAVETEESLHVADPSFFEFRPVLGQFHPL
jgi:hypothetical protein